MTRNTLVLTTALALLTAGSALAGESYSMDPAHSRIGFAVTHMTVSTVRGEFTDYAADLDIDEGDLTESQLNVTIQAASIDTRNDRRDTHLKSADFLDAENHPEITFRSKSIRKDGDRYAVAGDLTIRGVTKEVQLEATVTGPIQDPWGNMRMGVEAETVINRKDFGVSWNQMLDTGGLVVSDDVTIEIAGELTRPAGEEPMEETGG